MTETYEWPADCGEISGFGGEAERQCRAMVSAGCRWLADNPNMIPDNENYRDKETGRTEQRPNRAARELRKICCAGQSGLSGAQAGMVVDHCVAFVREFHRSWPAYIAEMQKERADHDRYD